MPRRHKVLIAVPVSAAGFAAATEGLVELNLAILRGEVGGRRRFPPLLKSRVVYKRERRDVWRDIQQVYRSGWGDCEDLASIRVAQLRYSGVDPKARVDVYKSGPKRYHAVVERGDGRREDPSRKLGMLPKGRSPFGTLEGDDMQHDLDGNETDEWALEELGGEFDMDELGFDDGDFVGRGPRHGAVSMQRRRRRRLRERKDRRVAYSKRRVRAKKMMDWCTRRIKKSSLGHGAWVGVGDDPLSGDPNVTFDLYRSGRGWSGLVRIPTSLIKAGRRQAIIAKTTRTAFKRRRKKRRPRKRRTTRRKYRGKPSRRRKRRTSSKRRTVSKAINLAAKIARLPGVSAFIPPQAAAALKLLKHPVAKLALKGAGKVLKKLKFW